MVGQEASNFWIEGPYYMDFDSFEQLRIVGPGNHLFLGLVDLYKKDLEIKSVSLKRGRLNVEINILKNNFLFHDPVVRNIRRVRKLTEESYEKRKNYKEIVNLYPDLEPNYIFAEEIGDDRKIFYRRRYGNHWYGVALLFQKSMSFKRDEKRRGFILNDSENNMVSLKIIAESDRLTRRRVDKIMPAAITDLGIFEGRRQLIRNILDRSEKEVEHLITYDKTSGFEYGTIFPRDWMEAADLGEGDLPQEIIDYMYKQALKFVTKKGKGWHEDVIGEYLHETLQANAKNITRHMIDIEPRYILGLRAVSEEFIEENKDKLCQVANYVLREARNKKVITFKKKTEKEKLFLEDEFWQAGNWRDSASAYSGATAPIAPFDVNVVYMPAALKLLSKHKEDLNLKIPDIDELIAKWEGNYRRFKFENKDKMDGLALAIFNVQDKGEYLNYKQLKVNHLDESFYFVYLDGNEKKAVDFAKKMISKKYFYTPAGPTLVDHRSGYSTKEYHGEVIWIKQVAFAVMGLYRMYEKGISENWEEKNLKIIKKAIVVTSENIFSAVAILKGMPELYYYNKDLDRPAFYDTQEGIEAQMSKLQLWSAVGIRQIIRIYYKIKTLSN
ncbi:MAG: hypothetical protein UT66_C0016G0009 [candidate division CPR2 bacterium GW2011_GWC1_39_9]|uniref:Glycogen debranching enzyme C-terminal domain-containing protein n=1 Tax=candidate division CPR2 bacterium GW2011_GWC2_39_10 TaxID=1618345 RepID=A0A0G0LVA2_UNCC2|nr:MAG: hypothetical protein UT18_C0006G0060 [candidate division CPR2 bacterium GW2011_GWC2_39_10]KKR34779.1 MAG: hypothetical protein UT66_C0016G0009 [candidate division CPR2 bacterium GW2011_GWC1_39_9]